MEYKKGHIIKPKETLENGRVIFTDGTNDVDSNQISCEAYGYKWNRKNNTCTAFKSSYKIGKLFQNTTNTNIGNNKIEGGTENVFVNGSTNTTKGQNRNTLVNGEGHEVTSGINNSTALGRYAKVKSQGQVAIGGGIGTSDYPLGNNQTSIIQLGGLTTDATATKLTTDGTNYIEYQNNGIMGFEVKVIGLCYGGSSGTSGDYVYQEIKGAVKIDNGYTTTFSQSTTTIASVGTTGTAVMVHAGTDPYLTVQVTGTANVSIEWYASLQLTEKKLNTDTF